MFDYLTKTNGYTNDNRKQFDPTNYPAFKRYESGYALFLVVDIPNCLAKLTEVVKGEITGIEYQKKYKDLITTYIQVLEKEFTGLQGLENITSETVDYDGRNEISVSVINKVSENLNPTITLSYTELYGAVLTRVHELFLKGIDDTIIGSRKHYNGLIDDQILAPSFANETFSFLYLVTDNTGYNLEKAYYIFNAQPTSASLGDLYNSDYTTRELKEVTCEFKCNIATGDVINSKAREILSAITGIKYETDENTKKTTITPISKPILIQNSDVMPYNKQAKENMYGNTGPDYDYAAYKALTGNGKGLGTLNNTVENLPALVRQLNGWYESVDESKTEIGLGGDPSGSKVGNNNDPNRDDPNGTKDITIDMPVLEPGQTVYIIPGATGLNAHDDIGKIKVTSNTKINKLTMGKIVSYVSYNGALKYAKDKNLKIIYANSKLHPYKIELTGAASGKWCFRIQDICIKQNGKLVTALKKKPYDTDKYGKPVTDSPKFKDGEWILIRSGATIYNAPYNKSDENNQKVLGKTSGDLVAKISYVTSQSIAETIVADGGNSDVYSTYATYGVRCKGTEAGMLDFKASDIKTFSQLNNAGSGIYNQYTIDKICAGLKSTPLNIDKTKPETLTAVINEGGTLPSLEDMRINGWIR